MILSELRNNNTYKFKPITTLICISLGGLIASNNINSVKSSSIKNNCDYFLNDQNIYESFLKAIDLKYTNYPHNKIIRQCFLSDEQLEMPETQKIKFINKNIFKKNILYQALSLGLEKEIIFDKNIGILRDGALAWRFTYLLEATVLAFTKTKDTKFLDLFVEYMDKVINLRDDNLGRFDTYHGRVMKAWGSINLNKKDKKWVSHITHNARIIYPATEFSLIVKENNSLKTYLNKANEYIEIAEEVLNEFDNDFKKVKNYPEYKWYIRPIKNKYEATNHLHIISKPWINLYKLTEKEIYKNNVQSIIDIFIKGTKNEPDDLISWNYIPFFAIEEEKFLSKNATYYSEPYWKAGLTSTLILKAKNNGYKIPENLISSISKTFEEIISLEIENDLNKIKEDHLFFMGNEQRINDKSFLHFLKFDSIDNQISRDIATIVSNRSDLFPYGFLSNALSIYSYINFLDN